MFTRGIDEKEPLFFYGSWRAKMTTRTILDSFVTTIASVGEIKLYESRVKGRNTQSCFVFER